MKLVVALSFLIVAVFCAQTTQALSVPEKSLGEAMEPESKGDLESLLAVDGQGHENEEGRESRSPYKGGNKGYKGKGKGKGYKGKGKGKGYKGY